MRTVLVTEEHYLSNVYIGIKEKVLDKRQSIVRVVPIGWASFKFVGIATWLPDPTNKQRLFVVS